MALAVVVFVGDSYHLLDDIITKAKGLKVDSGHLPTTDVAPVAYKELKDRIVALIKSVE